MHRITDKQISLLLKEGNLSMSSIGHGLTLLRKADLFSKGEFYQSFFQLTIGLERLMKLIIIQNYRIVHREFPTNQVLRSYGHKIDELYSEVSGYYSGRLGNPIDLPICKEILSMLSSFATSSRYYNLDELTNSKKKSLDPIIEWKEIQDMIRANHKKRKTRKDSMNESIIHIMNENAAALVYDENNAVISNVIDLYESTYDVDYIQGYAVYYTLKIINYLVDILIQVESKEHIFPYLREFFYYYHGDWLSSSEQRKKRNWVYV
jgi:hypothetical protein